MINMTVVDDFIIVYIFSFELVWSYTMFILCTLQKTEENILGKRVLFSQHLHIQKKK